MASCVVVGNKFPLQVTIVGTCFWVVVLEQREKFSIDDQLLLGPGPIATRTIAFDPTFGSFLPY